MRVWIETYLYYIYWLVGLVTLYVRVWIETKIPHEIRQCYHGHPLREGVD